MSQIIISQRINNDENENDFHFKIVRQKSKTNKNVTFESSEELHNLTQHQVDLRKEQEQLLEFEVAPLTCFMAKEQTKNPPTTVVKDLEKELNQDFSIEDNVVCTQNIIAKKGIKLKRFTVQLNLKLEIFLQIFRTNEFKKMTY